MKIKIMKIKFIKMVVFRDCEGNITHIYHEGDTIEATAKTDTYFVCSPGGIHYDEAIEIS